jgi:cytoskeleton protein RodZ
MLSSLNGVKFRSPSEQEIRLPTFGEKLKQEREKRKITLEQISVSTKIGTRMLQALEEDKFNQLPGGIFNKGFVRAYARFVGLDEDQIVAEYLQASGDAAPVSTEIPTREDEVRERAERMESVNLEAGTGPRQLPWGVLAAVLLIVALALYFWKQHQKEHLKQSEQPVSTGIGGSRSPQTVNLGLGSGGLGSGGLGSGGSSRPDSSKSDSSRSDMGKSDSTNSRSRNSGRPNGSSSNSILSNSKSANAGSTRGNSPSSAPQTAAATSAAGSAASSKVPPNGASNSDASLGGFAVALRAREESWVSITADGKTVGSELLPAGSERAVHGHRNVVIKVGNAGAIDLQFNGKKIQSLGDFGEVKTVTFGPGGVLPNASAPPSTR